jgi:hypothetical protein
LFNLPLEEDADADEEEPIKAVEYHRIFGIVLMSLAYRCFRACPPRSLRNLHPVSDKTQSSQHLLVESCDVVRMEWRHGHIAVGEYEIGWHGVLDVA